MKHILSPAYKDWSENIFINWPIWETDFDNPLICLNHHVHLWLSKDTKDDVDFKEQASRFVSLQLEAYSKERIFVLHL